MITWTVTEDMNAEPKAATRFAIWADGEVPRPTFNSCFEPLVSGLSESSAKALIQDLVEKQAL